MNGTTHPLLSLLDHFSSPLAGGGLFIQQSTKSQLPPPNLFHMALSLSLFLSHSLLASLSLLPGIGVRYLVPSSTSPHYCARYRHAFTPAQAHTQEKRAQLDQPGAVGGVQSAPPPSPSLSLSPSLGQNNNEPPGPRLNRSRRIMT